VAAESYQKVNGKNYCITLADGYAFVLVFEQANFKHLTGVQHLKDAMYHSMAPNQFFKKVLCGAIGDADLRRSVFYEGHCRERIFDLCHMPGILHEGALCIHPFDPRRANASLRADVLIYEEDKFCAFLTLACKHGTQTPYHGGLPVYFPESFQTVYGNRYLKGQTKTRISSIKTTGRGTTVR
jgi:hypothetical protein